MFPYQIYQALSDQRIRDLMAEARQYELASTAMKAPMEQVRSTSPLSGATAHLLALLHVRSGARASLTLKSGSAAGPMGCSA